ncbi:MAG TPA: antibiotic biosynthesis monooxygenase [Xanthobacteraceae bacterium]|nr:antibiotic biosynthesis monooxygenase [Xanthobacteraceae bacterium]
MRAFFGMLIAAAAAAVAPAAMAQAPAGGTAYVVTYIEVVPSAKAEAGDLLKQVAVASRKEAGNQRYDILQRIDRDNQFVILEAWTDQKAAEAHASGGALKQFKDKLKPLQAGFYDERPSVGIAVAPSPASLSEGAIYVITHVDVAPPRKDDCIALLKSLADDIRKEPNAEGFAAWQQTNRTNHFTVTEVWKNLAAYDAHIAAASTKEFREKLGPMSGALYDERFYKSL